MPTPVTPIIYSVVDLLVSLIKVAKDAKELNERELDHIKNVISREFAAIPRFDDL